MEMGGVDFKPWLGRGLSEDRCFVCNLALDETSRSVEDVFPKWLQRRFPAWRDRALMLLPNLTGLPLRPFAIPCCKKCNNEHLSRLEKSVQQAFDLGPAAVERLGERTLRGWTVKIAYGSRRNDLRLRSDIRDRNSSTIATVKDLEGLAHLHDLLQECRGVAYVPNGHSTFATFLAQESGCELCDFDAIIPLGWPSPVILRLGKVVVVGAIDDRGLLNGLMTSPLFAVLRKTPLHPIQVRALAAMIIARSARLNPQAAPLKYGVSEKKLWIARAEANNRLPKTLKNDAPSADTVLASLLNETEGMVKEQGGALGLLRVREGHPTYIPFRHDERSLSAVERTALLPNSADLF